MENEKKNTILSDEELKEITGGANGAFYDYCTGHTTEASCPSGLGGRCYWHPSNTWSDPITGEFTGGVCLPKGVASDY